MAAMQKGHAPSDNYTDDAAWDRRQKHRLAGLAAIYRSRDFVSMLTLVSTGVVQADDAPLAPVPDDRACSKRQWELRMQVFRAAVRALIQQATRD